MPEQDDTAFHSLVTSTFEDHRALLEACRDDLEAAVGAAAALLVKAYLKGGKLILFGNGGSMSDALHIEGELVNRFSIDRPGVAAVALAAPASFTATANDYSYDDAFARMLQAHYRPGDVALGLSTSGNSENVVRALAKARELGAGTVALTGKGGGRCAELADVLLAVPSSCTPRIQEVHILAGHILCDAVERALVESGALAT
ncbi:MAG: phosphoheptose isomerase 2 [Planctomycetota bacterium]|nr:MAG: phosphoheptose isomerase 2 [Planctomycetota bacterium]